jgi:hypothetical protein
MAKILHLVKSDAGNHPWDLLSQQASANTEVSVVLIQDAVTAHPNSPFPTFALAHDAAQRGVQPFYPLIDDETLLTMIWDAETVVVW